MFIKGSPKIRVCDLQKSRKLGNYLTLETAIPIDAAYSVRENPLPSQRSSLRLTIQTEYIMCKYHNPSHNNCLLATGSSWCANGSHMKNFTPNGTRCWCAHLFGLSFTPSNCPITLAGGTSDSRTNFSFVRLQTISTRTRSSTLLSEYWYR